ncbi:nuclear transport factor 2 family protein [Actinoplanes sp. NPDC023714]|uniref:nuclear transport factor 2 family protein n=1 Tax=Actinoplanes sp. NPDC023714 TaxID=3154322 RepID=UPI0033DEA144
MLDAAITAWHDAVNARDLDAARAAVTDPVEVSGPRGRQSISAEAFTDWILRSGIRLRPLAHQTSGAAVVVEQEATWPETPAPARVATVFHLRDGRVSAVHRFDSLEEALAAARG